MTNQQRLFGLPDVTAPETALSLLSELGLELRSDRVVRRFALDTFDRSLGRAGKLLEATLARGPSCVLRLRNAASAHIVAALTTRDLPRFAHELPQGELRRYLAPLSGIRALLPVLQQRGTVIELDARNRAGKILLRAELWLPARKAGRNAKDKIQPYLMLLPLRGYDKPHTNASRKLKQRLGFQALASDPFSVPCPELKQLLTLSPTTRADTACKQVLKELLRVMQANEPGMKEDLDSEFLHDYRVAIRRTRTALAEFRDVFAKTKHARFRKEFAWLADVTSAPRDTDVHMLSLDHYRSILPARLRADIVGLERELQAQKVQHHGLLLKALNSARYARFLRDWEQYLNAPPPARTSAPLAQLAIVDVVGRRIKKTYRSTLKQGRRIDDASPAEAIHTLRKTGKRLRYLIELFASLYDKRTTRSLVKTLKGLQDNLGTYNDLQVQAAAMSNIAERISARPGHRPGEVLAVEMLREHLISEEEIMRAAFAEDFARYASDKHRARVDALLASAATAVSEK